MPSARDGTNELGPDAELRLVKSALHTRLPGSIGSGRPQQVDVPSLAAE